MILIMLIAILACDQIIFKGKLRPGAVLGVFFYFLFLVIRSGLLKLWEKARRDMPVPVKPIPTSVLDLPRSYRLSPMEVVLGFRGKKPIKIDLYKNHTLIAGVTGFGKTYIIVSTLIQLYSKGKRFTDFCDVYLFDYKADGDDCLHMWRHMVTGYYSISDHSLDEAVSEITHLANSIHLKREKRILVIIDEVAPISAAKGGTGKTALTLLASKLRSRGTLVIATQHPHFDIIPRAVTVNLPRKIGVHYDDPDQAQLIFRSRPPANIEPQHPGEFLLKEPGHPGFIFGIGLKPILPNDVRAALQLAAPQKDSDPRLQFLIDVANGLPKGSSLPGINKLVSESRETGGNLKQSTVSNYYKIFSEMKIISRIKRGQPYRLDYDFEEAYARAKRSIDAK